VISAGIWWDARLVGGPEIIWGIFGAVASGVFWIVLIAVIIKLVKSRPVSMGSPPSALRTLEERYARGEISHEEFVERREVLLGRDRSPASPPSGSPPPSI
jgi:uncharacterized membrane protein